MKHSLQPLKSGLFRVVAEEDNETFLIEKGQFGGIVSGPDNLSQEGLAWIGYGAECVDNARILDDAYVGEHARLYDRAEACDQAYVAGHAHMSDYASAHSQSTVVGTAIMADTSGVFDQAYVTYGAVLTGNTVVSGTSTIVDKVRPGSILRDVQQFQLPPYEQLTHNIIVDFSRSKAMSNQAKTLMERASK